MGRQGRDETMNPKVRQLMEKGVTILAPETVYVGDDVAPDRISSQDVTLYPGCRLSGRKTLVMAGARLGREGPVTVEDCQIGPQVELKGGFFRKSVFLKGSNMGLGAHVRDACILEEEASCAHTVGLKQTILFPFVTLGSLINFCDCLMAGGTSRKDHSEVGSSYIHFNFTANQDKATASLMGDVPAGVMLDQRPIFLGGQGGLVGPAVIGYGTVIAAGVVFRGDLRGGNTIVRGVENPAVTREFVPGLLMNVKDKVLNNIMYIANLVALKAWYTHVRTRFLGSDDLGPALLDGAVEKLDMAFDERIARLKGFVDKIPGSLALLKAEEGASVPVAVITQQEELLKNWNRIDETLKDHRSYPGMDQTREGFLAQLTRGMPGSTNDYTALIKGLPEATRKSGTAWLKDIVQEITAKAIDFIPSFK